MTPEILFHNQVLLIIIACLKYFSRTEDLKDLSQFGLVKSFVLSYFHFYLVKKGFDKRLCISPCIYGGSNHIRFAELSK